MTKEIEISDEVVEKALSAKTEDFPEGVQYILIRGLSAMGAAIPSTASWDVMRAALHAAITADRARKGGA